MSRRLCAWITVVMTIGCSSGCSNGCSSEQKPADRPRCIEGRSLGCACTDGESGAQVCDSRGAFSPCHCARPLPELPPEGKKRVSRALRKLQRKEPDAQLRELAAMLARANSALGRATSSADRAAARQQREEVMALLFAVDEHNRQLRERAASKDSREQKPLRPECIKMPQLPSCKINPYLTGDAGP